MNGKRIKKKKTKKKKKSNGKDQMPSKFKKEEQGLDSR